MTDADAKYLVQADIDALNFVDDSELAAFSYISLATANANYIDETEIDARGFLDADSDLANLLTDRVLHLGDGSTVGDGAISVGDHTADTTLSEEDVDGYVADNGYVSSENLQGVEDGPVHVGDYYIRDSKGVSTLNDSGITEIMGNLIISGDNPDAPLDVVLSSLLEVDGDIRVETNVSSVSVPNLTKLSGSLSAYQAYNLTDVNFASLLWLGQLSLYGTPISSGPESFPVLERVTGSLWSYWSVDCGVLDAIALELDYFGGWVDCAYE